MSGKPTVLCFSELTPSSKARIYSIEGIEDLNNITIAKVAQSIRNVISSRYPSHLGKDNTITRYIHTAHPGGRGIELAYTPDWSLAYKASLKVSSHRTDAVNNTQASLPDGTVATLYHYPSRPWPLFVEGDPDLMATGHLPVHSGNDDDSALVKTLRQVSSVAKKHEDLDSFLNDIFLVLPRNGDATSFSKMISCRTSVVTQNPYRVNWSDTEVELTFEAALAVWIRGEQDDRDLLPATQHKD